MGYSPWDHKESDTTEHTGKNTQHTVKNKVLTGDTTTSSKKPSLISHLELPLSPSMF